ncbi:ClpP family protease [Winogradskyella sp.]|uniref:ClpP family protease n=1 Tax=Winogradskyella sp. TaxID=1883156 RepID=UPI003BACA1C9
MKNLNQEFTKYARLEHGINSTSSEKYIIQSLTPYIVEERMLNVAQMDVFSRLMMDRIIFLGQAVEDHTANIIQAQLLFLQSLDAKKDISLYINSPGGSVYAGFGIYDTMQYISPDVATICTGMAASMGSVLLCAGAKGKRSALKHSRVMIHQTSSGAQGTAKDIEISVKQVLKVQNELFQILADHSDNDLEKIRELSDRDYWMTAKEAKELGFIDEILLKT